MCNNLVLIGFMGSGKSTIGKELSTLLNYNFIDSDCFIEKKEGRKISEIFQTNGEEYFRNLEKEFIQSHRQNSYSIIATGGGMPIYNDITQMGYIIYLKADFNTIQKRIKDFHTRPLFADLNKAYALFLQRQKIYEKTCNLVIDANNPLQKILQDIMLQIKTN
ncbi:shikimate kinase [Helicobacter sp. faydin-H20]|uniref:shikimate kinase n=1 Tax=Helicobacter anatolicus TaxID=2905874 RepID=UPI001E62EEB6|nr:shikimate kinase [Helicobacter anatolicus]